MATLEGSAGCQEVLHISENLNRHIKRDFYNSLSYKCFQLCDGSWTVERPSLKEALLKRIIELSGQDFSEAMTVVTLGREVIKNYRWLLIIFTYR